MKNLIALAGLTLSVLLLVGCGSMLGNALSSRGSGSGTTGCSSPGSSGITLSQALGFETYNDYNQYNQSQVTPTLQLAVPFHASVVRTPISWEDYLSDGDTIWPHFRQFIAALPKGVHPLFEALTSSTSKNIITWPTNTADAQDYTSFVMAIYSHLQDLEPNGVDIEIGNEPNIATQDTSMIQYYADLVIQVSNEKKNLNLPGRVIAPAVTTYYNKNDAMSNDGGIPYMTFLNYCLAEWNKMGVYPDCFSIHIYGMTSDEAFNPEAMLLPGGSNDVLGPFMTAIGCKPFIVSNTGASTGPTNGVTPADQSSKIIRSLLCCLYRGAQEVVIYEARDRQDRCDGFQANPGAKCYPPSAVQGAYGIVNSDYTPKPAYTDLLKLMGQLGGYTVTKITTPDWVRFTATLTAPGAPSATLNWSTTPTGEAGYPYNPVANL